MRYQHFLAALFVLWMASLFVPRLPMPVGLIVYFMIAVIAAYSAIKHRSTGWVSGILFAALLLGWPLVIGAMYVLYERWRQ